MKYVHAQAEHHRSFNARTSARVKLPDLVWGVDPITPVAGKASYSYGSAAKLVVSDASTGEEKFTLDAERAQALGVQVDAVYGGKLYLKTTNQHPVVVATGKTIEGNATRYPTCSVGQWTYWSDGMLEMTAK